MVAALGVQAVHDGSRALPVPRRRDCPSHAGTGVAAADMSADLDGAGPPRGPCRCRCGWPGPEHPVRSAATATRWPAPRTRQLSGTYADSPVSSRPSRSRRDTAYPRGSANPCRHRRRPRSGSRCLPGHRTDSVSSVFSAGCSANGSALTSSSRRPTSLSSRHRRHRYTDRPGTGRRASPSSRCWHRRSTGSAAQLQCRNLSRRSTTYANGGHDASRT